MQTVCGERPQRSGEALILPLCGLSVQHLRRGKMAEYAFQFDLRQALDAFGECLQISERKPKTRHASIDFQVDRNSRSEPLMNGRLGQGCRVLQTEHRGRKRKPQGVVFFSSIYTAHHQHASGDAGLAQDDPLIGRRYPEPLCAFLFKRQRAPRGAVSVGVAFHHRADGDIGAHVLLQYPEIVTQGGKRNFSPIGPGLDTRRCKGCPHQTSIIQASSYDSPAARGLLNSFMGRSSLAFVGTPPPMSAQMNRPPAICPWAMASTNAPWGLG